MRRPDLIPSRVSRNVSACAVVSEQYPANGGRSATGVIGSSFVRRAATRWPAVVALVAAWPVGVAAAAPGFNSGDLLVWGIAALFAFGVTR